MCIFGDLFMMYHQSCFYADRYFQPADNLPVEVGHQLDGLVRFAYECENERRALKYPILFLAKCVNFDIYRFSKKEKIIKKLNYRFAYISKFMKAQSRFPHGISHLPFTAFRDLRTMLEYLPYISWDLYTGT